MCKIKLENDKSENGGKVKAPRKMVRATGAKVMSFPSNESVIAITPSHHGPAKPSNSIPIVAPRARAQHHEAPMTKTRIASFLSVPMHEPSNQRHIALLFMPSSVSLLPQGPPW